jgi:hypothetical protein
MTRTIQQLVFFVLLSISFVANAEAEKKTLNVLFIGNSFTARHNLSTVVKAMAEAGNSGLAFNHTKIIYGGSTLKDHWRLGTQNVVKQSTLTEAEEKATISALEKAAAEKPKDRYAECSRTSPRVAAEDRKQPAALGCRRAPVLPR